MDNTNEHFRLCNDFKELENHLVNIQSNRLQLILWQNISGDKKIIQAHLIDCSKIKTDFYIDLTSEETHLIGRKKDLFLFCKELHILVKGSINQLTRSKIKIQVDSKFYLEEKRKKLRLDVLPKDINLNVIRIGQHKIKKKDLVKLKNISNTGCGFIISASRATLYHVNMVIQILQIDQVKLETPINGKITHITPIKAIGGINDHSILVGISFDHVVENIDHVLQQVEFGLINLKN